MTGTQWHGYTVTWLPVPTFDIARGIVSRWSLKDVHGVEHIVTELMERRDDPRTITPTTSFVFSCSCKEWGCRHTEIARWSRPDPDAPRTAA